MTSKSALGEALRVMNPKRGESEKVNTCSCGSPLIFTLAFPYAEWYCLNCGGASQFLGRDEAEMTPELRAEIAITTGVWKVIRKYFLPMSSFAKDGCRKCEKMGGYPHREHLTEQEKLRDKLATRFLKKVVGYRRKKMTRADFSIM